MENSNISQAILKIEARLITEALKRTNGQVTQTSKILGISRSCLYQKIKKYCIPVDIYRDISSEIETLI